jgi:hypothetical protein
MSASPLVSTKPGQAYFARVIVAHGGPPETEARERLHAALTEVGCTLPPLAH